MSTYDAGAIEASADIRKDPFLEGLKQIQRAGDEFSKRTFTATADIDTRPAIRALDSLETKADRLARKKFTATIGVDSTGNVRFDALIKKAEKFAGTTYKAKVILDIGIADVKLKYIEDRLAALAANRTVHRVEVRYHDGGLPNTPSSVPGRPGAGGGGDLNTGQFSVMGTALVTLIPAATTLLGLAVGLAGAFGFMGAAGILAFKGVQDQEKRGTVLGEQYAQSIKGLKSDLTGLETIAAHNLLGPLQADVALLNQHMPTLNTEVARFATIGGKISTHLLSGVLADVTVLDPLFNRVGTQVLRVAEGFDRWSNNGGLQKFEQNAMQNLPEVEHVLGQLLTLVVHLTQGMGPFGMVSMRALGLVSEGINAIPMPVLKVLVTTAAAGYLAFMAWTGLAPAIATVKTLVMWLKAYEVQQLISAGVTAEAAAANASAAGGLKLLAGQYGGLLLAASAAVGIVLINNKISSSFKTMPEDAAGAAKSMADIASGAASLQSQLTLLGDSGKNLHSDLENAFAESNWTKVKDFDLGGMIGHPFDSATDKSRNFFKTTDAGLSLLVQQGSKAAAQGAFKVISDQAAMQGITVEELLRKLPKYKSALDDIAATTVGPIKGLNGELMATVGSLDTVAGRYHLNATAAQAYASMVGISADQVKASTVSQAALASAVDVVSAAERTATGTTSAYLDAVNTFSGSAGTAADRAALIGATLKAANGDALGYAGSMVAAAQANQSLVTAFDKQQKAAINLKTGLIDYKNAAAGPLIQNLQALQDAAVKAAGATYQHEYHTRGAIQASKDATTQYYAQTHDQLIAEARQLGLTGDQAKALADRYLSLPKDIQTQITAIGADPVVKILDKIGAMLAHLTGQVWVSQFDAVTGAATSKIASLRSQIAGVAGQHYNVYFDAHTSGNVPRGANQASLSAYGNIFTAYAGGGLDRPNAHQPNIFSPSAPGHVRIFAEPETRGEAYIPLANDGRRPRAREIAAQTVRLLGGAAAFAGGGFDNVQPSKLTGGGKKAGGVKAGKGGGYIFNNRFYSTYQSAEGAVASAGDSTSGSLSTELSGLGKLATATASVVATAMGRIVATVQKAVSYGFADSKLVTSLRGESSQLQHEIALRTKYAKDLANAQKAIATTQASMASTQSSVATAIMGGFNFGTSGNGYAGGITSSLDQQVADAKKFQALLKQAQSLGLGAAAIDQIAQQGPANGGRNLQAIVAAGSADPGYIAHLNSQYAALGVAAQGAGAADANALYGKQLATEQAAATAAAKAQLAEQKQINKTMAAIQAQIHALELAVARQAAEAHQLALLRARANGAKVI